MFIYLYCVKQKDDNKIAQIFSATLKLVEKIGVAGITMRQIAHEANMATGTLYIYFKDKNELINALFEKSRKSSISIYLKGYDVHEPFEIGFKTVWKNIFRYRIENFEEGVFLEQCYHSPFIGESIKEMGQRLIEPMYKLVERGKREKKIKNLDTFLLLTYMIGSVIEMVRFSKYSGKPIVERKMDEIFSLCWQGMRI
jgi:TetR/AcrR family transcriptional regulator, repressor of fatR-cypB operon